jgi:nicotinamide-nucleotide adenylyltransferase
MADANTCLFVGRFQPFHRGHLMVVKGMTKVCDKIVIAVGSCKKSETEDNPFTAQERMEMIQRALQEEDIIPKHDVVFIEVEDTESDEEWTQAVLEEAGEVDTLWTGNDWTKECFEGTGVEIQEIKEVPGISATEARERMKSGGDWQDLLPDIVASYIKSIGGVKRIKNA